MAVSPLPDNIRLNSTYIVLSLRSGTHLGLHHADYKLIYGTKYARYTLSSSARDFVRRYFPIVQHGRKSARVRPSPYQAEQGKAFRARFARA
jgi:hypothetical protein